MRWRSRTARARRRSGVHPTADPAAASAQIEEECPLCRALARGFHCDPRRQYLLCPECGGIFCPRATLPTPDAERARYLQHRNDLNDPRYQQFVMPIVTAVTGRVAAGARGLDFGAGTAPVLTHLLRERGHPMAIYDPFFHNDRAALAGRYDFIVCCEVIEHFRRPREEFMTLHGMLAPGGWLIGMTSRFESSIDFSRWRYKDDPTHVFIYQSETLEWIKYHLGWPELTMTDRVFVFRR